VNLSIHTAPDVRPFPVKRAKPRIVAAVGYADRGFKAGRRRTGAVGAAIIEGEALREHATGARLRRRENKGGRPTENARDRELAREFLRRRKAGATVSDSALKAAIGARSYPALGRTASIDAINRGLKILSRKESKPDN
jgi:hypothetical protein